MPYNPACLDNLKPFTTETSPRNGGSPKGFISLTNHLKSLSVTSASELLEIIADKDVLPLRKAAARQLLIAAGELKDVVRPSDILSSFGEVADRTEGKPAQTQRIEHTVGETRPAMIDTAKFEEANRLAEQKKLPSEVIDEQHDQSSIDKAAT